MSRGLVCSLVALLGALLAATSIQGAQAKAPRFLVTISGTQHFEWTLEDSSAGPCSYKGRGDQSETFGTSRPVKVIAPPARTRADRFKEFQAFNGRGWGRVVPLAGRELRVYQVLRAPTGECQGVRPELRKDCRGTNPLLSRAGVAIIRDQRKVALHVPVDTPWIERRPSVCDIRLFDLRNFFLAAVFGLRTYKPTQGGTFENRRAKTLRVAFRARYCVDPSESSDFEIVLDTACGPPPSGRRGPVLSGELTTTWSITFRRAN
jgi:hypothetical protein